MAAGDPIAAPLTIHFGAEGHCGEVVRGGWSAAEHGFRWMTGADSDLAIAAGVGGDDGGDTLIEFDLFPFVRPPTLVSQRLTIAVNAVAVGHCRVALPARLGFRIPAAVAGSGALSIKLGHPDAARPSDFGPGDDSRRLSMSVRRLRLSRLRPGASGRRMAGAGGLALPALETRVGVAPDRFMLNFESLGDNCELGVVQRRCGAEPLSLLRFSAIELLTLLRGLEVGFDGLGGADDIDLRLDGAARPEYVVHERRYGLVYHTFRHEGDVDPARLLAGEPARLAFRVRKFLEDLRGGEKIFVVKRNDPLREEEVLPLVGALSAYGRNAVLWMVPADAAHASGTVEAVLPGLFKGYIERFAPYDNAHDLRLEAWLEVCANAHELWLG
jgi:hypothetical protein